MSKDVFKAAEEKGLKTLQEYKDQFNNLPNNIDYHSLNSPCPNCGYCPHCGRGGYRPYQPHIVPYWPPYYPYTGDLPEWQVTTTISAGGNISGIPNAQSFNVNQY